MGTTDRTTLAGTGTAGGSDAALILRVHRSNFFMEGFVESPSTGDLTALAHERRLPFVEDLGSGALVDLAELSPDAEAGGARPRRPTNPGPAEILAAGADLVFCFSGDKLLGGPAGIIAGRVSLVAA